MNGIQSYSELAGADRGVTLARLSKTDNARRCFEHAIRVDPRNRIAAENLKVLGRDGPPAPR
jgi:Flp pilus assembly protein TadD